MPKTALKRRMDCISKVEKSASAHLRESGDITHRHDGDRDDLQSTSTWPALQSCTSSDGVDSSEIQNPKTESLTGPDPELELIEKMRKTARRSFDAKDYAKVDPMLQNILGKSEEKFGARFEWKDETMEMRAITCWQLGKWDEADKLFNQKFKGRSLLLERLAKEAFGRGDKNLAERILNKQFDGRESIMELLANSYIQEKKWKEAKQLLEELMQYETDNDARLERMYTLANVCFALKDIGEAEAWCLKAVIGSQTGLDDRNPQIYEPINLLAKIYNTKDSNVQSDAYEAVLADLSPGLHGKYP